MVLLYSSAFVLGLSGAMMPGPLLTYTIRKALAKGWKAGFIITAGHALLEIALIALIMLGFGKILQTLIAQIIIGMAGGLLLTYMGYDMLKNAIKNNISVSTEEKGTRAGSMVLSGILISASNPYFLIWWTIIGLGFILQAIGSYAYLGAVVFYLGHITADLLWYGVVSTVVGKTRKFIKDKPYRIIIASLGFILVLFGFRFIYGAVKDILSL
ncbi:MAG: LysE family transporter [Clostridiales bacterium]|nr:LysE family transporter [Clostridiales bacterium]